jgi:hypothetical protein
MRDGVRWVHGVRSESVGTIGMLQKCDFPQIGVRKGECDRTSCNGMRTNYDPCTEFIAACGGQRSWNRAEREGLPV